MKLHGPGILLLLLLLATACSETVDPPPASASQAPSEAAAHPAVEKNTEVHKDILEASSEQKPVKETDDPSSAESSDEEQVAKDAEAEEKRRALYPAAFNKIVTGNVDAEEIKEAGLGQLVTEEWKSAVEAVKTSRLVVINPRISPPCSESVYRKKVGASLSVLSDHQFMKDLESEYNSLQLLETQAMKNNEEIDFVNLAVGLAQLAVKLKLANRSNEETKHLYGGRDINLYKAVDDRLQELMKYNSNRIAKTSKAFSGVILTLRSDDSKLKESYPYQWMSFNAYSMLAHYLQAEEQGDVESLDEWKQVLSESERWRVDLAKLINDATKTAIPTGFALSQSLAMTASQDRAKKYYQWASEVWRRYKEPHNEAIEELISAHSRYIELIRGLAADLDHEFVHRAAKGIIENSEDMIAQAKANIETRE